MWDSNVRLTWEEFKGNARIRDSHFAITYSVMTYDWKEKNNLLIVESYSYFDKRKSWVKDDQKTEHLLKHEQGHFDITEIFSRKFKKRLSEERMRSRNAERKIKEIFAEINEERKVYQSKYDAETNFSSDHNAQAKWNEKIAAELESLKNYEDKDLRINL